MAALACGALSAMLALCGCPGSRAAQSSGSPPSRALSWAGSSSQTTAFPRSGSSQTTALPGAFYPSQGHTHLQPGEPDDFIYSSNPPTSGPHRELFTDTFISSTPLPKYVQVHLLEHGNVLLQYNCRCPQVEASLAAIAMHYNEQLAATGHAFTPADVQNAQDAGQAVIVAPYPSMHSRIALTAWTRLATLSGVDQSTIAAFINAYRHNLVNANQ